MSQTGSNLLNDGKVEFMLQLQLGVPCLRDKNTPFNLIRSFCMSGRRTNEHEEKVPRKISSDERGGGAMRIINHHTNQNADNADKKADMDKSVPTPGIDLSEQSKENGSFGKATKSGCANMESASEFSWWKVCSPAEYC